MIYRKFLISITIYLFITSCNESKENNVVSNMNVSESYNTSSLIMNLDSASQPKSILDTNKLSCCVAPPSRFNIKVYEK